jgi:hypothetical protein
MLHMSPSFGHGPFNWQANCAAPPSSGGGALASAPPAQGPHWYAPFAQEQIAAHVPCPVCTLHMSPAPHVRPGAHIGCPPASAGGPPAPASAPPAHGPHWYIPLAHVQRPAHIPSGVAAMHMPVPAQA